MTSLWNRFSIPLLPLVLLLPSCRGIDVAPASMPRIEVEVIYEIDYGFVEPLAEADLEALDQILRSAVEPMADVGLRFYPVASDDYLEGQARADYALTIRALRFEPERRLERVRGDAESGEEASVRAELQRVQCAVTARFERRRADGPNLRVGEAVGEGSASPKKDDATRAFRLDRLSDEVNDTEVTSDNLRRALEVAAKRALVELQLPIDRELSLLEGRQVE